MRKATIDVAPNAHHVFAEVGLADHAGAAVPARDIRHHRYAVSDLELLHVTAKENDFADILMAQDDARSGMEDRGNTQKAQICPTDTAYLNFDERVPGRYRGRYGPFHHRQLAFAFEDCG
jgi:hypothetical protein